MSITLILYCLWRAYVLDYAVETFLEVLICYSNAKRLSITMISWKSEVGTESPKNDLRSIAILLRKEVFLLANNQYP